MALPIVAGGPPGNAQRLRVFLSYAHDDAERARIFVKHFQILSVSLRRREEDFFYDVRRLEAGYRWADTLHDFLDTADLLVFLVSVDSLDPKSYCMTHEVAAAAAAGIPIVPVVLTRCAWEGYPIPGDASGATFGALGALPRAEDESIRPVQDWAQADAAWYAVIEGLSRTLASVQPRSAAPRPREVRPAESGSRPRTPAVRTDLIAYLCDQTDPERGFRNSLRTWDSRALVVLVKGLFDDNPDRFWERLRAEILLDWVERGPLRSPPLSEDRPFTLPRRRSRRGFKEEMERDLLDELSDVLTGRALGIENVEDLAAQMRTPGGVISLLAIPHSDADATREGVEALLRLIEKLPGDVSARMVVVVSLEDPALLTLDLVTRWELRRFKHSLVVDLDPLSAVTLADARAWYRRREIGELYHVQEEDVIDLFTAEETLRMRPFDARVQPLLRGRGRLS